MKNENVVVGAGICGLCLSYLLSQKESITLIESKNVVGGLSRSFKYGEFTFDIGPHRFHTNDNEVKQLLVNILGDDIEYIIRKSGVYLNGVYHDWPIKPKTLLKLPPKTIINAAKDLIFKKEREVETFEDYIHSKYGKTVYDIFFKQYTKKFTLTQANQIHPIWAKTGIDRAVIDERQSMNSLFDLAKNTFFKSAVKTKFSYCRGGIGVFSEKLAKRIRDNGSKIITDSPITGIKVKDDKIIHLETLDKNIFPKHVFWTAPITTLTKLLDFQKPDLEFLSTIIYNIEIKGENNSKYQWCYFRDDDISFVRTSTPLLFSKSLAPEGKSSICVEVTCKQGDKTWKNPESKLDNIRESLYNAKLIPQNNIEAIHIEKIPDTYPLYKLNFQEELNKVKKQISKIENITLNGRCGKFWYNNMDHSIKDAINTYKKISE